MMCVLKAWMETVIIVGWLIRVTYVNKNYTFLNCIQLAVLCETHIGVSLELFCCERQLYMHSFINIINVLFQNYSEKIYMNYLVASPNIYFNDNNNPLGMQPMMNIHI